MFAQVPWVARVVATALLSPFRHVGPMIKYTSRASPKHFMCMCFTHAPHAQNVVARYITHTGGGQRTASTHAV